MTTTPDHDEARLEAACNQAADSQTRAAGTGIPGIHVGRNWTGHLTEDACPCPKEPCGLVNRDNTDPDCTQHPFGTTKTMRQGHPAESCPGAGA